MGLPAILMIVLSLGYSCKDWKLSQGEYREGLEALA